MNDRKDRILIPSTVALIAFVSTVVLASDITRCPYLWHFCISGKTIDSDFLNILLSTGIITVGIGYLCHALFTGWTLFSRKSRLVDFTKLISAFCLTDKKLSNEDLEELTGGEQQKLEDELLAEFHLRLHSHAPRKLIEFCTRRNTLWYVAMTSSFASILGYLAALAVIFHLDPNPCSHVCGLFLLLAIFSVVTGVLFFQGTKWNREFWAVCWKWIYLDVRAYPFPSEWPERMKDTYLKTIIGKLKKNDSAG